MYPAGRAAVTGAARPPYADQGEPVTRPGARKMEKFPGWVRLGRGVASGQIRIGMMAAVTMASHAASTMLNASRLRELA